MSVRYDLRDFGPEGLAVVRRAAGVLLGSGFLLITEADYVGQVIERCDEVERDGGPGAAAERAGLAALGRAAGLDGG